MTLIVHAYARGPDGELQDLAEAPRPPRNDLAGVERWRTAVYGSDAARDLGLRLLPTLATDDLHAEGEDLRVLEDEVRRMLAATSRWPDIGAEQLEFRLHNILEAIRLARGDPSGGVYLG